jgi:hypothetical protein
MTTRNLLAGLTLALVLSGGAYAQTPAQQCCPAGLPKQAETEGATHGPTLADTEANGAARQLASGTTCRPCE